MTAIAVTGAVGCARPDASRPPPTAAVPAEQPAPPTVAVRSREAASLTPPVDAGVDTRPRGLSMEDFPTPVERHTAVWTGQHVLFWGGDAAFPLESNGYAEPVPDPHADGGQYDPEADAWRPLPAAPIAARFDHGAVWTGSEMIVWGGRDATRAMADGAAFNPQTQTWRTISAQGAPTARTSAPVLWTGSAMLVVGGANVAGAPVAGAFAYDPKEDRWRTLDGFAARAPLGAVWTGREVIAWGDGRAATPTGVRGGAEGWTPLPTAGAPAPRANQVVAWAGGVLLVWGGRDADGRWEIDGGRFDPQRNAWAPMRTDGALSREFPAWVSFDDIVVVLGYADLGDAETGGSVGLYSVAHDRWWATEGPYPSSGIAMAWTGTEVIAWGGFDGTNMSPTGERMRLR